MPLFAEGEDPLGPVTGLPAYGISRERDAELTAAAGQAYRERVFWEQVELGVGVAVAALAIWAIWRHRRRLAVEAGARTVRAGRRLEQWRGAYQADVDARVAALDVTDHEAELRRELPKQRWRNVSRA